MASSAPVVATPEPSGPVATPSPTVFASATLSPNAVETCTTSCLYTGTASLYTAYYYDYRCQGRDDNELAGCNLAAFDSSLENCRVCVINRDEFEAEGGGVLDWPPCPCCVAENLGFNPQTDECIAGEVASDVAATPAPYSPSPAPTVTTTAPTRAPTPQASPSPRSIPTTAPTAVPSPAAPVSPAPVSPAPSSLALTSSGNAEQVPRSSTGSPTSVETGSSPNASATGSSMPPSSGGSGSTEFPMGSRTWSPTGSPTAAFDSSGAEKPRMVGLEGPFLVLLLVLGLWRKS